jgi:hypothetical protein
MNAEVSALEREIRRRLNPMIGHSVTSLLNRQRPAIINEACPHKTGDPMESEWEAAINNLIGADFLKMIGNDIQRTG